MTGSLENIEERPLGLVMWNNPRSEGFHAEAKVVTPFFFNRIFHQGAMVRAGRPPMGYITSQYY